ncbi:MAG TPA: MFS transporter [Clostridia bacterium]|nr:MFS transporter [Clostridia bacterium]
MKRLKQHPLINTLINLKGNQRACVYTEPLWGIPFNLYAPYATLYMYALGVKDQQIGLLLTIGMIFQVVASLFGGIATDKLGRRKCTFIFDIISWSIPPLIWTFSQNFWWFLIATIFNSMWQITNNSWNCLLVEDGPPKLLVDIYTWCTISGLLSVFFAPLAGVLMSRVSLVPSMRILYGFAFLMMTAKFIILVVYSKETKQGLRRMEETKDQKVLEMLAGYKDVFMIILRNPATRTILVIMTLINITAMISTNFFGLYINKNLLIPEQYIAVFPIIRALVMLIFIFTVQAAINRLPFKPVMAAGAGLYILANVVLLLAKPRGYGFIVIYMLCESFAHALLVPRKDSLLVLFVDPQERARILGLIFVIVIGISSPFGWISGRLSQANRMFPFIFNILLYVVCAIFVLYSKALTQHDRSEAEEALVN